MRLCGLDCYLVYSINAVLMTMYHHSPIKYQIRQSNIQDLNQILSTMIEVSITMNNFDNTRRLIIVNTHNSIQTSMNNRAIQKYKGRK